MIMTFLFSVVFVKRNKLVKSRLRLYVGKKDYDTKPQQKHVKFIFI